MQYDRLCTFTTFEQPGCAATFRYPQTTSLPACIRVIYPAFKTFDIKPEWIGSPDGDEFSINERMYAVKQVTDCHRHILAQSQRIVLIDPGVIA